MLQAIVADFIEVCSSAQGCTVCCYLFGLLGRRVWPFRYSLAKWQKYSGGATKEDRPADFLQASFDTLRSWRSIVGVMKVEALTAQPAPPGGRTLLSPHIYRHGFKNSSPSLLILLCKQLNMRGMKACCEYTSLQCCLLNNRILKRIFRDYSHPSWAVLYAVRRTQLHGVPSANLPGICWPDHVYR